MAGRDAGPAVCSNLPFTMKSLQTLESSPSPPPSTKPARARLSLLGRTTSEIVAFLTELGEQPYRGRQVADWIYRRAAHTFEEMTNLPKPLRERLSAAATPGRGTVMLERTSTDGTVKALLRFSDGESVETVYLPYEDRLSVCISTQAGCPAACAFCATGTLGLKRNLIAGEIVDQLLLAGEMARGHSAHAEAQPIDNVVLMGMGEPLLNYQATIQAIRLMSSELGLSVRKITLSTVGIVPAIRRLGREGLPLTLAVSLHAPTQPLRERLIPLARKNPLAELVAACRDYFEDTGRRVTYEYILLADVNDSLLHARQLGRLLRGHPAHVNLIPYNPGPALGEFRAPEPEAVARFREALETSGVRVTQRVARGQDIEAACGQLHRTLRDEAPPGRAVAALGHPVATAEDGGSG